MSAQIRYRSLIQHIGNVYSASSGEQRTGLLKTGLDDIVNVVNPVTNKHWSYVNSDSQRLLKVWVSKESDPAAQAVVAQITDILSELSMAGDDLLPLPDLTTTPVTITLEKLPNLILSPPSPILPVKAQSPIPSPKLEPLPAPALTTPKPVPHPAPVLVIEEKKNIIEEEEDEEVVDEGVDEEEEVVDVEEEVVDEEEEVVVEEEEVVVEEEEEAAEEGEDEGMEVETYYIRGRAYWHEVNTHKLYAVIGEDDMGDEVGELVNGKPHFYAK